MKKTQSELHTHLMGMLSIPGLLTLLDEFKYPGFPINEYGELDFKSHVTRVAFPIDEIYESFSIENGDSKPYDMLDTLYRSRSSLLADIATHYKDSSLTEQQILDLVYSRYLNLALNELVKDDVDYVEISYANSKRLSYMLNNIPSDLLDKINVKFLLCTNRTRPVNDLNKDIKNVIQALDNNMSIGFDFMGREIPFTDSADDSRKKPSHSYNSFKNKLDIVIETLAKYPNSVLRIHAGENIESKKNPLSTLLMIDQIANQRGITIPPPEIRLGHAIYFEKCQAYLDLLKKYKCIVEINAISNLALSNIQTTADIPYNYYIDNDIPLVLSTDGGGIYNTNITQQNEIASNVATSDNYKKIVSIDKDIRTKKGRN